MIIPPYLQDRDSEGRELAAVSFDIKDLIELKVVSSIHTAETKYITVKDYTLQGYISNTLAIKFDFLHPEFISLVAIEKDILQLRFLQGKFFQDVSG